MTQPNIYGFKSSKIVELYDFFESVVGEAGGFDLHVPQLFEFFVAEETGYALA